VREIVRWRGVELRHLEALAAVGEQGSFHRAAAALGYSQSAISQQIAALERAVGRRLLNRSGGSRVVEPTAAGFVLIAHANAIGARLAAAEEELVALDSPHQGRLRLGVFRSSSARVVPAALRELKRALPAVDVQLTQASGEGELLRALERGELDVALVHLPILRGPFGFEPLPPDEYVLVMPVGGGAALRLGEVASLPLLGFRECRSVEPAYAYIRSAGYELQVAPTADDALTLVRLVAAGLGAAILPRLAVEHVDGVEVLALPAELPRRATGIAWHRDLELRPAASAFVRAATVACARLLDADSTTETTIRPHVMASAMSAA
jgi:DNA-binding transcriptional LysR family regulator